MKNLYIFMAHLDDFECSCFAYLSKYKQNYDKINLIVASFWEPKSKISDDNIKEIEKSLGIEIKYQNLMFEQRKLTSMIDAVKEKFYGCINFQENFDILTHSEDDVHTDHTAVSKIAEGLIKYAQMYTTVYSPSSYRFDPNLFIAMEEPLFLLKKKCLDKYNIQNEQSFTKLGYYLQSDDHYNIGKSYFLERFANRHDIKYSEIFRIEKIIEL